MYQVAEDVWQIPLTPRSLVNAYLLGDVVVDAGAKPMGGRLLKAVAGRGVQAHAITHAHPDHAGGSKAVCEGLGVPFWCPAGDADATAAGRSVAADTWARPFMGATSGFPAITADRLLREGDELTAGFVVLDTPGHSPGHAAYWRERDRVLIAGDVFFNVDFRTLRTGVRHPIKVATVDPERNRASQRKLAELRPELVLFGHGPALRDPGALARFVGA
jgi:glyoxylase-like metal-dependent hydrolase (beta-lactamase superfamily II)